MRAPAGPVPAASGIPLPAAIGVAVLVALALGAFSWWVDQLSWMGLDPGSWEYEAFGFLQALGNGPTLWLIGGFVAGAAAGGLRSGVVLATLSLIGAVAVYYALIVLLTTRPGGSAIGTAALIWTVIAAVAGPVMGAAGGLWAASDGRRRWLGSGLLGASLVGVGLFLLGLLPPTGVLHVVGGLGAAWLLASSGGRLRSLVTAGVLGFGAFLATELVFFLVRSGLGPR